jgi:hypothetical protein
MDILMQVEFSIYLLTILGFLLVGYFREHKALKERKKARQQEKDHLRKV